MEASAVLRLGDAGEASRTLAETLCKGSAGGMLSLDIISSSNMLLDYP